MSGAAPGAAAGPSPLATFKICGTVTITSSKFKLEATLPIPKQLLAAEQKNARKILRQTAVNRFFIVCEAIKQLAAEAAPLVTLQTPIIGDSAEETPDPKTRDKLKAATYQVFAHINLKPTAARPAENFSPEEIGALMKKFTDAGLSCINKSGIEPAIPRAASPKPKGP